MKIQKQEIKKILNRINSEMRSNEDVIKSCEKQNELLTIQFAFYSHLLKNYDEIDEVLEELK